jgi:glycerol-3-phosphate acyltransferase PlsY
LHPDDGATLAHVMDIILWAGIGYILGSIPFGLILTALSGGGDIRAIGSGNIGATNVLRTGKKGVAAATLLLDAGKGALAVWLAGRFGGELAPLFAGAGAFAGHVHPLWLKFRGGKGVATLLGVSAALNPLAGLGFALAWLGVALASRISSLGGMVGGFAAAAVLVGLGYPEAGLAVGLLALWVLWTHRENIARLKAGTEPRIGRKA